MLYGAVPLAFEKFGGGLVLDVDPTEIALDQAAAAVNVDFTGDTLRKRLGRVSYNAVVAGTNGVLGLHRYYARDQASKRFLAALKLSAGGSGIYEDATPATFVSAVVLSGQGPVDFVGWKERVYAGNGTDPLQGRTGAGVWAAVTLLGTPATPVLGLARSLVEDFEDNGTHAEDPAQGWVTEGAALTPANDTTVAREGATDLRLNMTGATALNGYVHKTWAGGTDVQTALTGNVTNVATVWPVGSVAGLANGDYVQCEAEMVLITGIAALNLTVTRAQGGTAAAGHGTADKVTKSTLDLSAFRYVSVWYYADSVGLGFTIAAKQNDGAIEWGAFPSWAAGAKETWHRIRVPLYNVAAADRNRSPGLAIRFTGRGATAYPVKLYLDEGRPEGPLAPDTYSYYATFAKLETLHGELVAVREGNPSPVATVEVPDSDATLGVSVTVMGHADTTNYTHIRIYRQHIYASFARPVLVEEIANLGATLHTIIDSQGDDELALSDAPGLVSAKISPPIARTYTACNARLVAAHAYIDTTGDGTADTWYPWRLYLSRLGYPEEFGSDSEPTDPNAPGWLDIANRDHIQRVMEFDGSLLVFCDRAIYTLEGSGWDDFAFRKRADVGLDARAAVAVLLGRFIVFLATDGVRVLAPNKSQNGLFESWVVSDPVDSLLRAIPVDERPEVAFGVDEVSRLHVSFAAAGGAVNSLGLVFDVRTRGALTPDADPLRRGWTSYTGWGFSCAESLKRGGGDAAQLVVGDVALGRLHYLRRSTADVALETDGAGAVGAEWSAVAVSVTVADGSIFVVGQVLLVGAERVLVGAVVANTLTVTRAYQGTVGAIHAAAAPVYILIGWRWRGKTLESDPGTEFQVVYAGVTADAVAGESVTATPVLNDVAAAVTYALPLDGNGFADPHERCGAAVRGRFAAIELSGTAGVVTLIRTARLGVYRR